jgi:hypothetical protein
VDPCEKLQNGRSQHRPVVAIKLRNRKRASGRVTAETNGEFIRPRRPQPARVPPRLVLSLVLLLLLFLLFLRVLVPVPPQPPPPHDAWVRA